MNPINHAIRLLVCPLSDDLYVDNRKAIASALASLEIADYYELHAHALTMMHPIGDYRQSCMVGAIGGKK